MAKKPWSDLAESTRKRYLAWGKKQGFSASETQAYHASGRPMKAARGHARPKAVPKTDYTAMRAAGKNLRLADQKYGSYTIDEVIADALKAGMTPAQIILQFGRRKRAEAAFQKRGDTSQGRKWWDRKPKEFGASTALFWYH